LFLKKQQGPGLHADNPAGKEPNLTRNAGALPFRTDLSPGTSLSRHGTAAGSGSGADSRGLAGRGGRNEGGIEGKSGIGR
jgi:hypothetical protein